MLYSQEGLSKNATTDMRIRFLLAHANALCVKLLLSATATLHLSTFLCPRPPESNINMHGPICIITNASLALSLQI